MNITTNEAENLTSQELWVAQNKLWNIKSLSFELLIMRHGASVPNDIHQIVSDLPTGQLPQYGLTTTGKERVREAVRAARASGVLSDRPFILSSPFSRTLDTAKEVCRELKLPESHVQTEIRLKERYFGEYNFASTDRYDLVWKQDKLNPIDDFYKQKRVETVYSVLERTTSVVADLLRAFTENGNGSQVLLVLHGDVGQVLETGFRKIDSKLHREQITALQPAEIRKLVLKSQD